MVSDFAGDTARLYARYRRDLPAEQAGALVAELGIRPDDVVVDLGCGTGQIAVPVRARCGGVVAVDPEPGMLAALRERGVPDVVCVLGADTDLPQLQRLLTGGAAVGAVLIGNALHWMDEEAALRACVDLLRPGGGVGVVTQGPPLWLGGTAWQRQLRDVLEQVLGPAPGSCGSDPAALQRRVRVMQDLGLAVHVATWHARHPVDVDWVIGHLGSALPAGTLSPDAPGGLADALRAVLREHRGGLVEEVTTTAVIGRRAH
jgi:SAM-dependent methyltransferase